jgi:hypothetical protein
VGILTLPGEPRTAAVRVERIARGSARLTEVPRA